MKRADAITDIADATLTEPVSRDAPVMGRREVATSWDPRDVWLTRVKLPRDVAALRRAEAPAVQ